MRVSVAKRAEKFVEKYFKKTQKALSNQAEKRRKRTSICPYRSWTRGANICLETVSLGLATATIEAFWDEEISKILHLPERHKPLYVLPVGYPE